MTHSATKPRYVQVTDLAEIEAVKRGIDGELKAPIGGLALPAYGNLPAYYWADADSLRKWREARDRAERMVEPLR